MKKLFSLIYFLFLAIFTAYGQNTSSFIKEIKEAMKVESQLRKKAEGGDAPSQNALGNRYLDMGDSEKAVYWYEKSALQGNQFAQYNLACQLLKGDGVSDKDTISALFWLKKASEAGLGEASTRLGYVLEDKTDYSKSKDAYIKAIEQGDMDAEYLLGRLLYHGLGGDTNFKKAMSLFEKSAQREEPGGLYYLGLCNLFGNGCEIDYPMAFTCFNKSYQNGWSSPLFYLACMYDQGMGVEQNQNRALLLLKNSIEKSAPNKADAEYVLGKYFQKGLGGITVNMEEAFKYFILAYTDGCEQACASIGDCYYEGSGVERNYQEARRWYFKAAEADDAKGIYGLANCYYDGNGCPQDLPRAFEMYEKAARHSFPDSRAMTKLYTCYKYGRGVSQDDEEAMYWLQRAHDEGVQEIRKLYERLSLKRNK